MGARLDSLITLSPGFKTAVNVKADLENDLKAGSYISTEIASDVLLDLAENLHDLAGRRSRILTGTYGTGKSHLALVLARVYRDGVQGATLGRVLEKLGKWPGKRQKLVDERRKVGRFLPVLLEGDEGPFQDSLLRALDGALAREGLEELFPETAFTAALRRIDEIKERDKRAFGRLGSLCTDLGFESVAVLEGQLKNKQRSAYDKFCEMHEALFAGATFHRNHLMNPSEVYSTVATALASKRYSGIVVIWDEFGRYMERVVEDPRGVEGQSIQSFADGCCNSSGRHQVHLYLVCHRSLEEYVRLSALLRATGMSRQEQDEWTKISGRFREFNMRSTDREVFDLIDQVVVQNEDAPGWRHFLRDCRDYLDEWTDEAVRLGIFPELGRNDVHNIVTVGAYPLHPMAAFCLPRISQRVAQNERTLFTFLSDSGSDTLGLFLHETEAPSAGAAPPFLPADLLWDFFAQDVAQHPLYKRVLARFSQADALVDPDDALGKRVIKALALLVVLNTDHAPCTEDVLAFCLGLKASDRNGLREELKSLCRKEGKRERVLAQSITDGAYRFTGVHSDGLDAKIDEIVEERRRSESPAAHLRDVAAELSTDSTIPATAYSDDYMLNRQLELRFTDCEEMQDPAPWLADLGGGAFYDGYALVVLCEDAQTIRRAKETAATTLKHPQILIAIPKDVVRVSALLRRHDAIRYLERTLPNLYGKGADLREEWEQYDRDYLDAIGNVVKPLLVPEKRLLEWYADGSPVSNVGSVSRLRNAVSDMMRQVFPLTPRIAHERLTQEDGRDNFIGARRRIISNLLLRDGPELLAKEPNAQERNVIDMVYARNGILRTVGSAHTADAPDAKSYAAMRAVWDEVEKAVEAAKEQPLPMSDLVATLRRPPYGVRTRSISLIVAAVLRKYILRGNISFVHHRTRSSSTRITRIDGIVLDDAVLAADKYELVFTDIGRKQQAILFGAAAAFAVPFERDADTGELTDRIHRAVSKWWRGLAPYAQQTRRLDRNTLGLRDKILRVLAQEDADAQDILLNTVADIVHPADESMAVGEEAIADLFGGIKARVEGAVGEVLVPDVEAAISEVFSGATGAPSSRALSEWYASLPSERQQMRLPGDATVVVKAAAIAAEGASPLLIIGQLAKGITGAPVEDWSDEMLGRFRGRLEGAKRSIEEAEARPITRKDEGGDVVIPSPPQGQAQIILSVGGEMFCRSFVPVTEVSAMGENLRNIIRESIRGIGRSLPAGESETIFIQVLKELFE